MEELHYVKVRSHSCHQNVCFCNLLSDIVQPFRAVFIVNKIIPSELLDVREL